MEPYWDSVTGRGLRQGDWLARSAVPTFGPALADSETHEVSTLEYELIVVTQSCDLDQRKCRYVACVPLFGLGEFETSNPTFARKGRWNEVLKGRVEGLHLLASPIEPTNNRHAVVADFREVYSLPLGYLERQAELAGPRWRLRSPFLEHFSQAFARFFMRVGLPSAIPEYK